MTTVTRRHTVGTMPAIEVEDLFKSYGSVDAVRGISFRVQASQRRPRVGAGGRS
jgi:ABC-type histidine transport system ATPase subunit